jgi:hypothetical protein
MAWHDERRHWRRWLVLFLVLAVLIGLAKTGAQ